MTAYVKPLLHGNVDVEATIAREHVDGSVREATIAREWHVRATIAREHVDGSVHEATIAGNMLTVYVKPLLHRNMLMQRT